LGKLRPIEEGANQDPLQLYDFRAVRQKGSYVTLTNGTIYVTVPAKEIQVRLLSVILKDCGVPQDEFLNRL
jgi:predicted RNA binding protein YcfA (HicA-like mRNA interferase family)